MAEINPMQAKANNALEELAKKHGLDPERIMTNKETGEPLLKNDGSPRMKPGRKKNGVNYDAPKEEPKTEPAFDPETAQATGEMFFNMIAQGRQALGIDKPLNDFARAGFVQGFVGLADKHGDAGAKYMPEILFGSAVIVIAMDTFVEVKRIRAEQELTENEPERKREGEGEGERKPTPPTPTKNVDKVNKPKNSGKLEAKKVL